jgi:phosphoesterase RecJ-like protein
MGTEARPRPGPPEPPAVALERAAGVLSSATEVALSGHVNPDPDAIGSMLALASFLRGRGVAVICSWPNEPLELPRWLRVFDDLPPIVPVARFPKAPSVMVALDTASADRLATLMPNAERADTLIVLDHHASNPGFGDVCVVDAAASSTAEVAYRLMRLIGGPVSDTVAALIYAGLVTDTGRFQYQAVTPETLRLAAELRAFDFDHARLARALYEDSSLASLRLTGRALERIELRTDADLIWTHLTQADLVATGSNLADTDDLIDVVRMAREADVACVIKEQRDGKLKVSLRSRGQTDVGAVALGFGGGGHRLAAGYTSKADLAETVRTLVTVLATVHGERP